jgi:hypothetical protein
MTKGDALHRKRTARKAKAQHIIAELDHKAESPLKHDNSTNTLTRRYRKLKKAAS